MCSRAYRHNHQYWHLSSQAVHGPTISGLVNNYTKRRHWAEAGFCRHRRGKFGGFVIYADVALDKNVDIQVMESDSYAKFMLLVFDKTTANEHTRDSYVHTGTDKCALAEYDVLPFYVLSQYCFASSVVTEILPP
jgi:hypothetical protein